MHSMVDVTRQLGENSRLTVTGILGISTIEAKLSVVYVEEAY